MRNSHVLHVVGARPNFKKAAPVLRASGEYDSIRQTLVHTGQHYDFKLSEAIFQELGMPAPDVNLHMASGSHAKQTSEIMKRLEPIVLERRPDVGSRLWRRELDLGSAGSYRPHRGRLEVF